MNEKHLGFVGKEASIFLSLFIPDECYYRDINDVRMYHLAFSHSLLDTGMICYHCGRRNRFRCRRKGK